MATGRIIGVDLGGTKVLSAVIDDFKIVARELREVDSSSSEALVAELDEVISDLIGQVGGVDAIGFGVPSAVDYQRGISVSSVHLPIENFPVKERFEKRFDLPVTVENDGNCAALAESKIGAGEGKDVCVCLTIGTGVGSGVVIDGEIMRGTKGYAAEIGHMVIDKDGPPCPGNCPNNGCLESLVSGTALKRVSGGKSGEELKNMAEAGDQEAIGHYRELGKNLGVGIASIINIFNPDVICIGGGVSTATNLFLAFAIEEAKRRALPTIAEVASIVPAQLGIEAGTIGAGLLARELL